LERDKNYEKKINETSIKKIKTKSHGGLSACPIDKNVNSAKTSSREGCGIRNPKAKARNGVWNSLMISS
jgi:hypothetical protein